jgi:hypothetical protein
MSENDGERLRLPGLFRWSEVCDVFLGAPGAREEWRFVVKPHSVTADLELLYVVEGVPPSPRQHDARRHAALLG